MIKGAGAKAGAGAGAGEEAGEETGADIMQQSLPTGHYQQNPKYTENTETFAEDQGKFLHLNPARLLRFRPFCVHI